MPSVGTVSHSRTGASAASLTFSHTTVAGQALVVLVACNTASIIAHPSVTFNGVSLLALYHHSVIRQNYLYVLLPSLTTSTTANVVVTPPSNQDISAAALNISDFGYLYTLRDINSSNGTALSVVIPSTTSHLIVDFYALVNSNAFATLTPTASQTTHVDQDSGNGVTHDGFVRIGVGSKTGASGSTTMSWTTGAFSTVTLAAFAIAPPRFAIGTKFYLTDVSAEYSPATYRGSWVTTANAITRALHLTQTSGGALTIRGANSSGTDTLYYRGVSETLIAQTITGSVDLSLAVVSPNGAADARYHVHIYVTQGNSDTVRGTLLSDYIEAAAQEFIFDVRSTDDPVGQSFLTTQTLSSVTVQDGDRLVAEIGIKSTTNVTSFRCKVGTGNVVAQDLEFGGNQHNVHAPILMFSEVLTGPAPVAVDDFYTTPFGVTLTVPALTGVLANDTGLSLTAVKDTDPAVGTLTSFNSDGSFTYVPPAGFAGDVTFTYHAVNAYSVSSNIATVTITVEEAIPVEPGPTDARQTGLIEMCFGGSYRSWLRRRP